MIRLTNQQISDLLHGCTVLGTGGGGSLEKGLALLNRDLEAGKSFKMISLSELPDDEYIATPYACGAPKEDSAESKTASRFRDLPRLDDSAAVLAFKRLEAYMRRKFHAVSSTELGGENTAEALHIAAMLNLPIVDADPAGRAVPELQHSTYFLEGMPIYPLSVATNFGEPIIFERVCDDFRAEEIIRVIAVASDNEVGVADHPMSGKQYKRSTIPGMLSYALDVGKTLRLSEGDGKLAANDIAAKYDGKVLFHGEVIDMPWKTAGGFNVGEINYKGLDEFSSDTYRILIKNENMVGYRNDKTDIMIPDLICMIGEDSGVITTPNFGIGKRMFIIGLPAPKVWTTEKGLKVFGPEPLGFDMEYVPFER